MPPRRNARALASLNPNSTAMTPKRTEIKQLKEQNEALRTEMADLTKMLEEVKVQETTPTQAPTPPAALPKNFPTIPPPNFALIKTPDAPVRPSPAYIYFCNTERPSLKGMSTSEQAKVLGAKWKKTSEEEKAPYVATAASDKSRYDAEKKKFDAQMEKVNLEKASLVKLYEARKSEMALHYYEHQASGGAASSLPFSVPTVPSLPVREMPKKAKNAYNLYCNDRRQQMAKKLPEGEKIEFGESMKTFAAEWSKFENTKTGKRKLAKYNDLAAAEKERYAAEMEAYNLAVAEDENDIRASMMKQLEAEKKEALKRFGPELKAEAAAKVQVQAAKEQKKARKAKRELEPKRPRTAYIFFSMATRESVVAAKPEASSAVVMSELGRLWREYSAEDKQSFVQEAADDKLRYEREMEDFRSKNTSS